MFPSSKQTIDSGHPQKVICLHTSYSQTHCGTAHIPICPFSVKIRRTCTYGSLKWDFVGSVLVRSFSLVTRTVLTLLGNYDGCWSGTKCAQETTCSSENLRLHLNNYKGKTPQLTQTELEGRSVIGTASKARKKGGMVSPELRKKSVFCYVRWLLFCACQKDETKILIITFVFTRCFWQEAKSCGVNPKLEASLSFKDLHSTSQPWGVRLAGKRLCFYLGNFPKPGSEASSLW